MKSSNTNITFTKVVKQFGQVFDQGLLRFYLNLFGDRKGIRGLLFHTVFLTEKEKALPHVLPQQQLGLEDYRQIFEYFLENGYEFLGYSDLETNLESQGKYLYVTFDDGYYNNVRILPLIEELSIPVHIFVTTSNTLNNTKYWWDVVYHRRRASGITDGAIMKEISALKQMKALEIESFVLSEFGDNAFQPISDLDRPLSEYELLELSNHNLITIGNHTHRHAIATVLNVEEFRSEVVACNSEIKEAIGYEPLGFAFPNGNYKEQDLELLKSLGIDLIFSCEPKNNRVPVSFRRTSPWLMGRYSISSNNDLRWQADMVRAGGSPYFQAQRLKSVMLH